MYFLSMFLIIFGELWLIKKYTKILADDSESVKNAFLVAFGTEVLFIFAYFLYNDTKDYSIFSFLEHIGFNENGFFVDFLYFVKWGIIAFFISQFMYFLFLILNLRKKGGRFSKIDFIIICIFVTFLCVLSFETIYLTNEFSLDDAMATYFTLTNNVKGTGGNVIKHVIIWGVLGLLFSATICSIMIFLLKKQKNVKIAKKLIFYVVFCVVFSLGVIINAKALNIFSLFRIYEYQKYRGGNSEFYEKYYKTDYTLLTPPQQKRNLIYIVMESMETTFLNFENGGFIDENIMPNLTKLAKENINFSHNTKIGGGYDASGTSWTVAALLSKLGGLPFNLPTQGNEENLSSFLPGAITLTDIFADGGYNQLFICGSDKAFASRDKLYETHGNVEIHDLNYFIEQNKLNKEDTVFWGFEDKKLYDFAKEDITKLSKSDKPFFVNILTVDTHFPEGYICEDCTLKYSIDNKELQMKDVIECADRQIGHFIEWCKTQSWYENTTIVIAGDHLFMGDVGKLCNYSFSEDERRWINIFINVAEVGRNIECEKNRVFNSFDMFPTVLASLGYKIEGERFAFGTNLFSTKQTLAEELGVEEVNKQVMVPCDEYDMLMRNE